MCIVIDANTFHKMVDTNNEDFTPLNNWIQNTDHKIIHGGSTYSKELLLHNDFRRYLKGLERVGKTKEIETKQVDELEEKLKLYFINTAYDDHHLVAILFISGCKLVCSHDKGFHKLIKDCCSDTGKRKIIRKTSVKQISKVKIYQNKNHSDMLTTELDPCCV